MKPGKPNLTFFVELEAEPLQALFERSRGVRIECWDETSHSGPEPPHDGARPDPEAVQ